MGRGEPLNIDRLYTTSSFNMSDANFEKRKSLIKDTDGRIIFERDDVMVPREWSQLATDILVSKYFRKAGVPNTGSERSLLQVIERITNAISSFGAKIRGLFNSSDSVIAFKDELSYILMNQIASFNSPVMFNVGLKESYNILGDPAGNWHYDALSDSIVMSEDAYTHPAASACFILSVEDDLMDIAAEVRREMNIFKHGGGAGLNISSLRAEGEPLSGGGTSSGMMSFLEIFDKAAGATKSGGVTRRAARILCCDADHPDVVKFVQWKAREEDKVKVLLRAGYSGGMDGEAYKTVSGQNANNSVRVTDAFMQAVVDGGKWQTKWRTSGKVAHTFGASEIMDEMAAAAWRCGDPGIQFHTTINSWHTCPNSGEIRGVNPCSEVHYIDNCACNLASINLVKFLDGQAFDSDKFAHVCRIMIIAQEILVDYASYPTKDVAQNSHDHRILGLGYANLGGLLMRRGIPYNSDFGRDTASCITSLMTATAYKTSAEIARAVGPFQSFRLNRDNMLGIIDKHIEHNNNIPSSLRKRVDKMWGEAKELGDLYGFRNAQVTCLAPTGTIGLLMDCETTGVEPDFALVKYKKLSGGGNIKIVNEGVSSALSNLGYSEREISKIVEHLHKKETIEGSPHIKDDHLPVFDCAVSCGDGERYIDPMGHVAMVAAIQPSLSQGISKTVNLPHESTVEDIKRIYIDAWKMGVKAISVYRDGCKEIQPLSTGKTEKGKTRGGPPPKAKRYRLPMKRSGFTQEAKVGGHKIYVRTGEYVDGSLGEIFIDMHKQGGALRGILNSFAIAVSLALQHGVPLDGLVNTFVYSKFEPYGVTEHDKIKQSTSVVDFVFRLLGHEYLGRDDLIHVKDGETGEKIQDDDSEFFKSSKDAQVCPTCGHLATRSGTCYKCMNCGTSLGCS